MVMNFKRGCGRPTLKILEFNSPGEARFCTTTGSGSGSILLNCLIY